MLTEEEIQINKFAQQKLSFEELMIWFDQLTSEKQMLAISKANLFLLQAHPTHEDIELALSKMPIKSTFTPIVLLKTKKLKEALRKIMELPKSENRNAFISIVFVFKIADESRRENYCKNVCTHEWHNLFY